MSCRFATKSMTNRADGRTDGRTDGLIGSGRQAHRLADRRIGQTSRRRPDELTRRPRSPEAGFLTSRNLKSLSPKNLEKKIYVGIFFANRFQNSPKTLKNQWFSWFCCNNTSKNQWFFNVCCKQLRKPAVFQCFWRVLESVCKKNTNIYFFLEVQKFKFLDAQNKNICW